MGFRIGVILLNYRTPQLTLDCIESLEGEVDFAQDTVVIIENGSRDGSVATISEAIQRHGWQRWTRLIPSETNLGFPCGCNLGIRSVDADAYLLLNNDTIVRPCAVAALLGALQRRPDAGIISARLEWPDGHPQMNSRRYISPASEFLAAAATGPLTRLLRRYALNLPDSEEATEAEWVCFAAVLIRREVFQQVGLLDGDYFNYFDDVDYCRRAWKAGWRVLSWPKARVVHLVGASQSVESSKAARKRRPRYYYASRARYFAKFYGRTGFWLANLLWTTGRMVSLARELVGNKRPHVCQAEWRDIWTNWWNPLKPPIRSEVTRS